jgi:hypothetical protein
MIVIIITKIINLILMIKIKAIKKFLKGKMDKNIKLKDER